MFEYKFLEDREFEFMLVVHKERKRKIQRIKKNKKQIDKTKDMLFFCARNESDKQNEGKKRTKNYFSMSFFYRDLVILFFFCSFLSFLSLLCALAAIFFFFSSTTSSSLSVVCCILCHISRFISLPLPSLLRVYLFCACVCAFLKKNNVPLLVGGILSSLGKSVSSEVKDC